MKLHKFSDCLQQFEQSLDQTLPPRIWPLIRLEGRGFDDLIQRNKLQILFDPRLQKALIETAKHLMTCGFCGIYAYVAGAEISILFDKNETIFQRSIHHWLGVLAGEASASFSHYFGDIGVFIPRLYPIPDVETLIDYFRWRQETRDSTALHQLCYHRLLGEGKTAFVATEILGRFNYEQKLEFLRGHQITYRNQPCDFRLGTGLRWNILYKTGINPKTQKPKTAKRRVLEIITLLPAEEKYAEWLQQLFENPQGIAKKINFGEQTPSQTNHTNSGEQTPSQTTNTNGAGNTSNSTTTNTNGAGNFSQPNNTTQPNLGE